MPKAQLQRRRRGRQTNKGCDYEVTEVDDVQSPGRTLTLAQRWRHLRRDLPPLGEQHHSFLLLALGS